MKRILLFGFLYLFLQPVLAQKGAPLLSNYIQSRDIENQSWAICQDNDQVMLFANRKGVIAFDGDEYFTVKMPAIPYSMQKDQSTGRIYVGSDNSFGYLEKKNSGSYNYISVSGDSAGTGIITKIIISDTCVWFYGEQSVTRYNTEKGRTDLFLASKPGNPFTGMMVTPKNTFFNIMGKGLYRLEADTLFPIVTGYLTEKTDILFSLPYNKDMVLVGLGTGSLSLFDGLKYYDFVINDDGYIKDNMLSEGIALGDTAYAFSTLEGGAVVVDRKTRKILFTINNQTELPDDEIFAMGSDNTGGLWLSHQYGLTRADLNLPVKNYAVFPGLKGNLTSAISFSNELYVATSEGVYYLTEVKNYSEVEVLIKNKISQEQKTESVTTITWQEQPAERKNIFTKIFGKKTTQPKSIPIARTETKTTPAATPAEQYTKTTVSKLKSINYLFRKVDGLNAKCRQLVSSPTGILAATNKGLYVIRDHKAYPVEGNRYINNICWKPFNGKYFIAANDGYFSVREVDGRWLPEIPDNGFMEPVYSVFQKDDGTLWIGGDNVAYRVEMTTDQHAGKYIKYQVNKDFPERYFVREVNDSVFLTTETEMHFYNGTADKFEKYTGRKDSPATTEEYYQPVSNLPLVHSKNNWLSLGSDNQINEKELSLLKLFDYVVSVAVDDKALWVVDGNNKIYSIDRIRSALVNPSLNVFIKSISNDRGMKFDLQKVEFARGDNVINFNIVSPAYLKQSTTEYQYFINKIMKDWSPWSTKTHWEKAINRPGDYILQVRARNLWGNVSEPKTVMFTIKAPFTKTVLFYALVIIVLMALVILFFRFREKQLKNKNLILEEKVRERTAEIEAQKEEITASIEYAKRIQYAMLPVEEHFKQAFSDYFILFKPRDIVSGDFFWIGEDEKSYYFTVADCTGHGVPGAFMSTMGISALNDIISNNRNLAANKVLNLLRAKVITVLHQTGKEGEAADGMDIAFCVMNKERTKLQFSGAYNPLFIFQGGEFKEYKANRMPIGIFYGEDTSFTNFVINVNHGDTLYIFSDGYTDQFGGEEGSKFKKHNLKKLLSDIYYRPMVEQRNILEAELLRWKGTNDQVDDITIIGIRL